MVFSFLKKAGIGFSADLIAKKSASQEAFDGGVSTAFTTPEVIEHYFQKYGSTQKKFDYHSEQRFYIGYVKMPTVDEFLSVVLLQPNGSVVASFYPDMTCGQDMLGLMGKKAFADQVASQFIEAAGR